MTATNNLLLLPDKTTLQYRGSNRFASYTRESRHLMSQGRVPCVLQSETNKKRQAVTPVRQISPRNKKIQNQNSCIRPNKEYIKVFSRVLSYKKMTFILRSDHSFFVFLPANKSGWNLQKYTDNVYEERKEVRCL